METQELEYKDFSKVPNEDSSINKIKAKLFKEVSAMANTKGGKIIIGIDDKSSSKIPQPEYILKILENHALASFINSMSSGAVYMESENNNGIVTLVISQSYEVIESVKDFMTVKKGEVYIRINTECKKATPRDISKLEMRKIEESHKTKHRELGMIVHKKFIAGHNSTSKINIFDCLKISTVENERPTKILETQFDIFMYWQFIFDFKLPLSQHTTSQMYNNFIKSATENMKDIKNPTNFIKYKKVLDQNSFLIESLVKGWREEAYNSKALEIYIKENESPGDL